MKRHTQKPRKGPNEGSMSDMPLTRGKRRRNAPGDAQRPLPGVEVQAALEDALRTFDAMETRRWPAWVCYLLEGLEELRPEEIEPVLEAVKADIETRLVAGRW